LVKDKLLADKGIDLRKKKTFGPRTASGAVAYGATEVVDGSDPWLQDHNILRIIAARKSNWDVEKFANELYRHMEWRQCNIPLPILNSQTIKLMKRGALYIHGRAKDLSPIIVLSMPAIAEALKAKEITTMAFCQLHDFVTNYIIQNMLIPGQVDKFMIIIDTSKFGVYQLPVSTFREANSLLSGNFHGYGQKDFMVNLTWMQSGIIGILRSFLSAENQAL